MPTDRPTGSTGLGQALICVENWGNKSRRAMDERTAAAGRPAGWKAGGPLKSEQSNPSLSLKLISLPA